MKKTEKLAQAFEKYWSLFGLAVAICAMSWMVYNWSAFTKSQFWVLWAFIPLLMLHNFEESFLSS